jgi:hypothetical protein
MKTFKHPRTERKLKQQVCEMLDTVGAWYWMPVPSGYGRSTLDFIGCYRSIIDGRGTFFVIETKSPGNQLTHRQAAELQKIRDAGGIAIWGDNIDSIRDQFNAQVYA